nr:MAG TPA: hypothetical protein [Caudoviricetes sp.]
MSPEESMTATNEITSVTFSDSEVIAIQLQGSVIYPKDGKANVTAEQLAQLKEMGLVE